MATMSLLRVALVLAVALVLTASFAAAEPAYKYSRSGNAEDVKTKTTAGYALMGGGTDQDAAFKFLCDKSGGGDFLILTASSDQDYAEYNPYIQKLCKENSVATLSIASAEAANDPFVAETIRKAEALFITGGDQAKYVKYWKPSPMREAMQSLIDRGVPVGGTSAGLAILGEFGFPALNDSAYSEASLKNPFNDRVMIDRGFLAIPHLENTITDTHFKKRDRLGRTLVFMARILQDEMTKEVRGIGVDEKSAALLEADGSVTVAGVGSGVYFYRPTAPPQTCAQKTPLTFRGIDVYHVPTGGKFNLADWSGTGGNAYTLSVENGAIRSSAQAIY
jgi:cyanophycinase